MDNLRDLTDEPVEKLSLLMPDQPSGPLTEYRQKASFDWRRLRLYLHGYDTLEYMHRVWRTLEKDPLFARTYSKETLEEKREKTFKRHKKLYEYDFLTDDELMSNPLHYNNLNNALGMYDWALMAKYQLSHQMFGGVCSTAGTDRHRHFTERTEDFTTFELNTPDFEATKIWSGNLGKVATHAIVYAQLYTPDGKCHGLNTFVVPVRDPNTLLAYPGVTVGDQGEKIGLNGLDNGFMSFSKYHIPRENLLNKTGDVTADGRFVTPYQDDRKRFGAALGALSGGRVGITGMAACNLLLSVVIAVRYSAVRKQFGPSEGREVPVLEYQLQQCRLMPYLSAAVVLSHFAQSFFMDFVSVRVGRMMGDDSAEFEALGREMHALSCASKPLASWTARDSIQECRECCGGHGYFAVNRFGQLRDDNDANCTYEGDNNVILQQTANYILSAVSSGDFDTPLGSLKCLDNNQSRIRSRFAASSTTQCKDMRVAVEAYQWLVPYLAHQCQEKLRVESKKSSSAFEARNNSQMYFCRSLALAYIESVIIKRFYDFVMSDETPSDLKSILTKVGGLYSMWCVEKHMSTLYQGGYMSGKDCASLVRQTIVELSSELKDDAVSLADVLAPPDFILASPIGFSDGEIYKNLHSVMMQSPGALERPSYWLEMVDNKPIKGCRAPSKL